MTVPKLHINDHSPTPQISPDSNIMASSSTRKSMHQTFLGKLRPLPLQYRWTVWYDKHTESNFTSNTSQPAETDPESSAYADRLYLLHEDVSDIATFYRVYNNYPWEKIRLRDSVHIFRKDVKPIWEDKENANGGCWIFRVPKSKAQEFFHEMVLLCLANEFQAVVSGEHDHVLGVSMTVHFNSHLIRIWNKQGSNMQSIHALEQTFLSRLSPELRLPPAGLDGPPYSYFYRRHNENRGYKEAVESK